MATTEPRIETLLRFNSSQRVNPNYAVLGTPINHRKDVARERETSNLKSSSNGICDRIHVSQTKR